MLGIQPVSARVCRWLGSKVGSHRHRCSSRSLRGSWQWNRWRLTQAGRVWLRGDTHLSRPHPLLLQHRWSSHTCIVKTHGERPGPDLSVHHKVHLGCDAQGSSVVNDLLTGVNYILAEGGGERVPFTHSNATLLCCECLFITSLRWGRHWGGPRRVRSRSTYTSLMSALSGSNRTCSGSLQENSTRITLQ